jgi:hypothetical protein
VLKRPDPNQRFYLKTNIVNHKGTHRKIHIFDTDKPGPNIVHRQHKIGGKAFCIKARDGIVWQAARPLRNHKLLRAIGFDDNDVTALTQGDTQTKSWIDYTIQHRARL